MPSTTIRQLSVALVATSILIATQSSADAHGAPRAKPVPAHHLAAIGASGADEVWALGYQTHAQTGTIARHWDGTRWKAVQTPDIARDHINDVAVIAPDNAWAVGQKASAEGGQQVVNLVLHWDGAAWTEVPVPGLPGGHASLDRVSAISADDVIASGTSCEPCRNQSLHWDGMAWSQVKSGPLTSIAEVDAATPTDAWGVGQTAPYDGVATARRWDGRRWRPVALPQQPYGGRMSAVADVAANDAWMSGKAWTEGHAGSIPWLLHWDGTTLVQTDPPFDSAAERLSGSGTDDV